MRQIIATAFFLLLPLSLSAQAVETSSVNERLLNAKVRELVFRLHITHSQKAEFTQIYRRYNEEMTALWTDSSTAAHGGRHSKTQIGTPAAGAGSPYEIYRRICQSAQR